MITTITMFFVIVGNVVAQDIELGPGRHGPLALVGAQGTRVTGTGGSRPILGPVTLSGCVGVVLEGLEVEGGIQATGCVGTRVLSCLVRDCPEDGIFLQGAGLGTEVQNCEVRSCRDDGISLHGSFEAPLVSGNWVHDVGFDPVFPQSGDGITFHDTIRAPVVVGNLVEDCAQEGYHGIHVALSGQLPMTTIVNNTFRNCLRGGISHEWQGVYIADNTIEVPKSGETLVSGIRLGRPGPSLIQGLVFNNWIFNEHTSGFAITVISDGQGSLELNSNNLWSLHCIQSNVPLIETGNGCYLPL